MTGIFARKPTLVGDRVLLRPFSAADIASMGRILADPEVLRLTGSVRSTEAASSASPELDDKALQWYATRAEQEDRLDLAVVDRATERCVGEVVLNAWSSDDDLCGFRILLGPDGRDRGFGSEATRLVIDHAFETTCLNRIELEVYAFNARAQHVYQRAGFVEEGRRREGFTFDGARIDVVEMAILRADWEVLSGSAGRG